MANMTYVNVNVNDRFIQRRVTKHLYCAVCAEWQRRNRFVFSDWSCCWWAASHGDCPVASSRPSDQRQRRSDDRKCWAGNVLRSGDVEWLTVNDVGWECPIPDTLWSEHDSNLPPLGKHTLHVQTSGLRVDIRMIYHWTEYNRLSHIQTQ